MSLDIIIGPMFAGKSSRIADIVSRYESLESRVLLIKPVCDDRYGEQHVTHNKRKTPCIAVDSLQQVSETLLKNSDIVIVDEAQFFTNLIPFCEFVVDTLEKKLYLVGLDGDSNRRKFGEILDCIPLADRVEKLHAFCRRCANGRPGLFSYRKPNAPSEQITIGGPDLYETLCRECYLRAFVE